MTRRAQIYAISVFGLPVPPSELCVGTRMLHSSVATTLGVNTGNRGTHNRYSHTYTQPSGSSSLLASQMKKAEDSPPSLPPGLYDIQLGVWRVVTRRSDTAQWHVTSVLHLLKTWRTNMAGSHALRLLQDSYRLGPAYFVIAVSAKCLSGLEEAISLWSLNRLLSLIEAGYQTQQYDDTEIMKALFVRVFFMCLVTAWRWISAQTNAILSTRMKLHFEERLLRAHLSLDVSTSQKNSETITVDSQAAWEGFDALLGTCKLIFTAVSQLFLVTTLLLSGRNSSIALVASIVWPLCSAFIMPSLWYQPFFAYIVNEPYRRLKALSEMARDTREVVGGGLSTYIIQEYGKARGQMGDTSFEWPWNLYSTSATPFHDIGQEILKDFPLIYYTLECLWSHSPLSIASLATLQKLCGTLESTVTSVVLEKDSLREHLRHLKELYHEYEPVETGTKLTPYSPKGDVGMEIELRNVTFHYPTSDIGETAIRDVSFSIPASSLVVIVGANRSGKSTLVNLLTGLHTPTTGELLIDGRQRKSYHNADLQRSIALLAQDHNLFNLSVRETIGIGDPEAVDDDKRVEKAARLGGSYAFIRKLNNGFDEFLFPVKTHISSFYPMNDAIMKELMNGIEKHRDVSGGEKQRLAASRTFMRIMSDKVKLVVVDEPTSAMDPLGEFELFEKLRAARPGKTMVFVTHRFGHLTKHANLVLCMKEGRLVEQGTHLQLMEKGGEYARLYNIQASAFSS